jgi:hypothetical protein
MSAPTDADKLAAALELLEAEQRRRIAEKFEAGELQPTVLGVPPDSSEAVETWEDGPITMIITGVPRPGRDSPDWKPPPNVTDCCYRPPAPPAIAEPKPQRAPVASAPVRWTKIQTQVMAPSEGGLGGVIAEGWFCVVGGELRVEDWRGRMFAHPIAPGDDAAALARKVLREKFGQHHSFDQPINYPRRSYH